MLRHYLLIVWRNSRKSPLYSTINVSGLGLGMAVAMLIGLWVWNEMSFDHYHRNHERIAEVLSIGKFNSTVEAGAYSCVPLAAALRTQYPDDFAALSLVAEGGTTLSTHGKTLRQWGAWVQAEFPEMFSLKMIRGSSGALKDPTAILLTASFARDLFGTTDVLGKNLLLGDSAVMSVGGVYEDLPDNTTISQYRYLLPFDNIHSPGRESEDDWTNLHFQLFVRLKEGVSVGAVSNRIRDIAKPHIRGGLEDIALHPMDKWHLYDRQENGVMTGGRLQTVRLFGFIGVLVLLLACINFMNLSTARSEKRAKEVGIRKTVGSLRGQLVGQFLCESIAMTAAALLLALVLAVVGLPFFNSLAGSRLAIPWSSGWWWLIVLGFTMITGVTAGAYPAFYLSAFRPTKVLKGALRVGRLASLPRQVLVVLQFAISMSLIIGTMVIYQQLGFARNRPVGYSREGLINFYIGRPELIAHADALRQELLATGAIREMAATSSATTEVRNSMLGYDWEGRDPRNVPVIGTLFVSYEFGRTVDWKIQEGRDFIPGNLADSGAFIINEAAAKYMGMHHPVGSVIRWHQVDHPIVGVVKDLVMESPYKAVSPVFYTLTANSRIQDLVVRLNPTLPVRDALARIEPVFRRWDPVDPFEYWFTDEAYGAKFLEEARMSRLSWVFAALAVVISCLGLFGLAAFVAEQRTKEIGIRKVLGASVVQLWGLLSKEFLLLVGLSFCLGAPVAFLYLRGWLQAYEYRVALSPWVFLAAGAGGMVITLVTVSGQAVRAAVRNPVRSLKVD